MQMGHLAQAADSASVGTLTLSLKTQGACHLVSFELERESCLIFFFLIA